MKTKQELIVEAYGDLYETLKKYINENGWIWSGDASNSVFTGSIERNAPLFTMWRPEVLTDLEENNGWTAIHSIDDLPEGLVRVECLSRCNVNGKGEPYLYKGVFIGKGSYDPQLTVKMHSHWRPLQKDALPLWI